MANDIDVVRGDTFTLDLVLTDSNGDAVNITGYTFFLTIKQNDDDTDADALVKQDSTSHSSALGGLSSVSAHATAMSFTAGLYPYDIQMKDSGGNIQTLIIGDIKVSQDITTRTS